MKLAPIAVFVYNRPDHTRQALEALWKNEMADISDLFIFSDAPKNSEAEKNVHIVRKYIKTIRGFKSVNIIERDNNMGLAASIINGVSYLCHEYGKVIVLEDDLIASPYFLCFMNEALNHYHADSRVMQISGFMFPVKVEHDDEACLLPLTTSWGWATWEHAWKHFDPIMAGYQVVNKNSILRKAFDLDGTYAYFKMLESQLRGEINSWAIRWYLSVFLLKGLVLYPPYSLIQNIGFDGSGMHCKMNNFPRYRFAGQEKGFQMFKFPRQIAVSSYNYKAVTGFMKMSGSRNMVQKIKRLF